MLGGSGPGQKGIECEDGGGPIGVGVCNKTTGIASGISPSNTNTISATITAITSTAPTVTPASGTYGGPQTVTMADAGTNHSIWYTVDGSTPVPGSGTAQLYTGPFVTPSLPATVKAVGMWGQGGNTLSYPSGYGYVPSSVVTRAYTSRAGIALDQWRGWPQRENKSNPMKKTLLFVLLSVASAFGQANQSGVIFTWTGTGNPALPSCSSTVTASCLTGYTLTDTTGSTPVVISSTIPANALTYTETPLPSVGAHTWSLVVNGKDQSGNSISSNPVTLTLTVPSLTPESRRRQASQERSMSPASRVGWMLVILLELVCLMMLAGCKAPSFTFDNGNPDLPACSASITIDCLANFTLTDITTKTVISTAIPPTATSYKTSTKPIKGSHTYTLTISGKNQEGKSIVSPPATVTISVP